VDGSCCSDYDCTCGESCFDFADGRGFNCSYPCTTSQDCVTATSGVWTTCWMGNGVGHCGL
jgi:hypothetical protein